MKRFLVLVVVVLTCGCVGWDEYYYDDMIAHNYVPQAPISSCAQGNMGYSAPQPTIVQTGAFTPQTSEPHLLSPGR